MNILDIFTYVIAVAACVFFAIDNLKELIVSISAIVIFVSITVGIIYCVNPSIIIWDNIRISIVQFCTIIAITSGLLGLMTGVSYIVDKQSTKEANGVLAITICVIVTIIATILAVVAAP